MMLGLKMKVSIGEGTTILSVVTSNDKIQILDSPGNNEDFSFYDPKTLNVLKQVDKIFLLFRDSLKSVRNILLVLKAIKPNATYVIRTQCDLMSKKDIKSLDEELQYDRAYLK